MTNPISAAGSRPNYVELIENMERRNERLQHLGSVIAVSQANEGRYRAVPQIARALGMSSIISAVLLGALYIGNSSDPDSSAVASVALIYFVGFVAMGYELFQGYQHRKTERAAREEHGRLYREKRQDLDLYSVAQSMKQLLIEDHPNVSKRFYVPKQYGESFSGLLERLEDQRSSNTLEGMRDQYQVVIDYLLEHAEAEGPTWRAKVLIELAIQLAWHFDQQKYPQRETSRSNVAIAEEGLHQEQFRSEREQEKNRVCRESDEARLVAGQVRRIMENNYDLFCDPNKSPELSSAMRCLLRTILESVSIADEFGLGRCSEALQPVFQGALRAAQIRLVRGRLGHHLWVRGREFMPGGLSGQLLNELLLWRMEELANVEVARRREHASLMNVIEVLQDHDEMQGVLAARQAWDPDSSDPFPYLPLPIQVLAGIVSRPIELDMIEERQMDERQKAEDTEASRTK